MTTLVRLSEPEVPEPAGETVDCQRQDGRVVEALLPTHGNGYTLFSVTTLPSCSLFAHNPPPLLKKWRLWLVCGKTAAASHRPTVRENTVLPYGYKSFACEGAFMFTVDP